MKTLRYFLIGGISLFLLAACQGQQEEIIIPTLIPQNTDTPAAASTETIAPTDTESPTEVAINTETPTPSLTFTPSATNTSTPTITPTPTETIAPTETFTSTPTKTLAPTLTPTSEALTAVVVAQALNVRNGPGDSYDVVDYLDEELQIEILGTDGGQDWYFIEYGNEQTGWIYSGFAELESDISDSPNVEPTALPQVVRLEGISHIWQSFNNCAPTALTIALTYYGGPSDVNPATDYLRPSSGLDVSVDIAQMADYVNDQFPGVQAQWRMGGNWTTIRQLLAAGFPILIETSVQVTGRGAGWAGHNRVIMGYDGDYILTYDSYLGHGDYQGFRILESELDEAWRQMNRNYMVLYPAQREDEVAYLMGAEWLVPNSVARAHRVALAEMATDPDNAFAQYNLGTTYAAQGQYEEAVVAFDRALEIGVPFRMLWYQFAVYEAYYYSGRYDDVIENARRALLNMGGNGAEEVYYWLGLGYFGRGELERAQAQFENAISFNGTYEPAIDALERLQSGTLEKPV